MLFDWLKPKIVRCRFERRFQRYEREQRDKHWLEAQRRFGAEELRREIASLSRAIEAEADRILFSDLQNVNAQIGLCQTALTRHEAEHHLLSRDYREELDVLYENMSQIKTKIGELYEKRKDAFERKNRAKASIEAWYSKSERSFLGNKGKQIPRNSLFGQSFGDLNSYKADRDSASDEIISNADEISELKTHRNHIGDRIGEVKKCRNEMHALRSSGVKPKNLLKTIASIRNELSYLLKRRSTLEVERSSFREAARHRYGVVGREEKVAELEAKKARFLEAFETRPAHLRRRSRYQRIVEADWEPGRAGGQQWWFHP